jgi:penicillin-binding protein 2
VATAAGEQGTPASALQISGDNEFFYQFKDAISKVKIGSLESYQALFAADNIDYDKAMLIALELPRWPGVFLSTKIRREYLAPTAGSSTPAVLGESSFSHILGYTGKINDEEMKTLSQDYSPIDYIGKTGLESSWEKELKGSPGRKNIEVDALGRQKKIINEVAAANGANLQLSINGALQQKAEEVAGLYLKRMNLRRASVIIMNPNNGEIMALVSLPGYDNNLFAGGISQEAYNKFLNDPDRPLFSRAVSGEFPSGSTIKPIFAAGALQEKVINAATSFVSTGGLRIGEWFFPDWKAGGHGITDVRKALAFSVNTFFYYIGGGYGDFKGLGVSGLVKYAQLFGLGKLTGIDLPGERPGFVPTANWKEQTKKEPWYIGDTYHFAIGQGDVLVTPLQVAA